MKKVIKGILFNTETAECIASNSYSCRGNFHYWSEDLYRKKNGEFFLYGEGGAMSKYSVQIDTNSWGGGEDIIPLTEDEAKEWLENNSTADTYIEVFGEPEE